MLLERLGVAWPRLKLRDPSASSATANRSCTREEHDVCHNMVIGVQSEPTLHLISCERQTATFTAVKPLSDLAKKTPVTVSFDYRMPSHLELAHVLFLLFSCFCYFLGQYLRSKPQDPRVSPKSGPGATT